MAAAAPHGHIALTSSGLAVSVFDFKDGVGIADPNDQDNPCTFLVYGVRPDGQLASAWKNDLRISLNINSFAVGLSLNPPLAPVGGWLPNSVGINTTIPCPIPGYPTPPASHPLWLIWSGMNWRSAQSESLTELNLCTQRFHYPSTPGCLPIPGPNQRLIVAACGDQVGADPAGNVAGFSANLPDWATATFQHDYTDQKGKEFAGLPHDQLSLKNDKIFCAIRDAYNYTSSVLEFSPDHASQTFIPIKNEAVVRAGWGSTYMVVCWSINYVDFANPLAPVARIAQAHDWRLVADVNDPDLTTGLVAVPPGGVAPAIIGGTFLDALGVHLGGQRNGDTGSGATNALRGIYSESSTVQGENGFGPCPTTGAFQPNEKKPSPLV
jgi:hypothetical protein